MIYKLPSIDSIELNEKVVAIRANLDTIINGSAPEHNQTIKSVISTISFLLTKNCKIIIMGTLGEPNSVINDELSLMDVRFALGNLLGKPTKFVNIKNSLNSIKFMNFGEILVLENLKFNPEEVSEKQEDWQSLTEHLAKLVDVVVLDSVDIDYKSGSLKYLMKKKPVYLGLGLQKEIQLLKGYTKKKESKPNLLILGKEESIGVDKKILKDFSSKFDYIFSENSDVASSKNLKSVKDLEDLVPSLKSVVWMGVLEKDTQNVLEYLSLSVGKEVTKILGGRNLIEKLNHSKFKEKGISTISTSGVNLINILLGNEIKVN